MQCHYVTIIIFEIKGAQFFLNFKTLKKKLSNLMQLFFLNDHLNGFWMGHNKHLFQKGVLNVPKF
jgi:hypothetical protein